VDLNRRYQDTQIMNPFEQRNKVQLKNQKPLIGIQAQGVKAKATAEIKSKNAKANNKSDPNSFKSKVLKDDKSLNYQRPHFRAGDKNLD
jgi:hypothetical protein